MKKTIHNSISFVDEMIVVIILRLRVLVGIIVMS